MNTIREIQKLNQRELENVTQPSASWHTDYRDTAYIHIGGLSFELSEGDIITIFSQFGEPVWLKLARDKETGKSRGYAWLKYEDQRSCDLAVDNLGGAQVLGRMLKVDHTRYKKREDEEDDDEQYNVRYEGTGEDGGSFKRRRGSESGNEEERPMLKEEIELAELMRNHDDDDPMKAYLIQEKREEVAEALARQKRSDSKAVKLGHRHRHHQKKDRGIRDDEHQEHRRHRHSRRGIQDDPHKGHDQDHGRNREGDHHSNHNTDRDSRRYRDRPEREGRRDRSREHRHDREREEHSRRKS
jgi:RNA-binding motif X-linked protein 2